MTSHNKTKENVNPRKEFLNVFHCFRFFFPKITIKKKLRLKQLENGLYDLNPMTMNPFNTRIRRDRPTQLHLGLH